MKEVYTALFRSCMAVLFAGLLMFGTAEEAKAQCVVTFVDCPSDTVFYPPFPPQTCTQIVNWNPPSAVNNGDLACGSANPLTVTQVAGPTPGTPVNVGVYTIIYHASDANGASASCSFTVTVADTVSPTITGCPGDQTMDQETDTCGAHASWLAPVGSDACGIASFAANTNPLTAQPYASGDFFPVGTTTVIYTATDLSGNTTTCGFDITVNDTSAPVITFCPGNVTQSNDPDSCNAFVTLPDVEVDEDCPLGGGGVTFTLTGATTGGPFAGVNASGIYNVGVTTVTFNVDDGSGGTTSCSFTVTVEDTQAPVFTLCPADTIIFTSADGSPGDCANTDYLPTYEFDENCPPGIFFIEIYLNGSFYISGNFLSGSPFTPPPLPAGLQAGVNEWITIVSDDAGNSDTCTHTVTVIDDEAPTMACSPSGATFGTEDPNCYATVLVSSGAADNCAIDFVTNDYNLDSTGSFTDTFPPGSYTINFTAYDTSGNTSTCAATFDVEDDDAPVFSGCVDQTVYLDGACAALLTWTAPTALDNCDGAVVPVQTAGPPMGLPVAGETSFAIEYMVTDAAGNTASCGFTVFVEDSTSPTITCPADIVQANDGGVCGAVVSVPQPTGISDNCQVMDTTNSFNGTTDASGLYPVGITTVVWTVTDTNGNSTTCSHTVTVEDDEDPTVLCLGNPTFSTDPDSCTFAGSPIVALYGDNCDVLITLHLVNQNGDTVDMTLNQPGLAGGPTPLPATFTYPSGVNTVHVFVTDTSGNTTSCAAIVEVEDNEDPGIACPGDIATTTDPDTCGAQITFDVTASDNCMYVITNDFNGQEDTNQTQTFNDFVPGGITTIVFTVTDSFGNTATCDVEITIDDEQPPTVICPQLNDQLTSTNDVCFAVVGWSDPAEPDSLFDNCAGPIFITQTTGMPNPGVYAVGTYTIEYLATDQSGNTATCGFTFSVIDTARPVWTNCPNDTVVTYDPALCGSTVAWQEPTPSDNCVGVYDSSTHVPGDFFPVGTTTVVYTAYDSSGNTSQCSFTVTVEDNVPPTIVCPIGDTTLNNDPGLCSAVLTFADPVTMDDCGTFPPVQTSGLPSGSAFPVGVTTNTWIVTDSSGNTATCGFTVTVIDNEPPIIDCYPDMTVDTDPGQCDAFVSVPLTPGPVGGPPPVPGDPYNAFDAGNSCLTFSYVDISATGTAVLSGTDPFVDDVSAVVALGTPFTIYGTSYGSLVVSENGYLSTDLGESGTDFSNDCPVPAVPSNGGGGTRIYPHWDDFRMANPTDAVYYQYFPVSPYTHPSGSPMGASIFQWQLTHFFSSPTADFQAILFDNGDMVFQVADDSETGSGATIGIQSDAPGFPFGGTTYACNTGGTAGPGSVIGLSQRADICVLPGNPGNVFENCAIASIVNDFNGTDDASDTYPLGTTVVTYTVTDVNGNTATCQFSITVEDNEVPTISNCPGDITVPNDPDLCSAVVGWTPPTVFDNCGIASWTSTHLPGDVFPVGVTSVVYTALDVNGNTATCGFDVTVNDEQDPIIVCSDTIFDNDPGKCYTSQLYELPFFDDNCPGAFLTLLSGPAQGDTLPVGGPYTVEYMVTDTGGNTASCSFTITVIDSENPTTTCPSDIVVNNGTDTCGATVNYIPPFPSDNCITSTVTQIDGTGLTSGDVFPVGVTNQLYIVEDAAGNTITCGFTVTVIDNEAPVWANCPADITMTNDPGECGAIVNYTAPTVSDNCGATTTNSHNPGDFFPVGTTTVTYTAVDTSGNSAVCSFRVTITDDEGPSITCPGNITVSAEPGVCEAVVTYPFPSTMDNCFFELSFYDFETGPQGWTTGQLPGATNNYWNVYNTTAASGNNSLGTANDGSLNVPFGRENSFMRSPAFEVNGGMVQISFDTYINNESGTLSDVEFIEVSGDGGATWTPVHAIPEAGIHATVVTSTWTHFSFTAPGAAVGNQMMFRFHYDTGDDFGGAPDPAPIGWYVDNVSISASSPIPVQTAGLPSGSSFPVGTTTNVFMVTDNAGHTATCSFDVTVTDDEDPVIAGCPTDITVSNDPGSCDAVVSWTPPTATDNCGVTSFTSSHNPGEVFPVGTTTVTYTAMDAAGNSATCSFTITVEDNEAPIVTCPADMTFSAEPGTCGATVTFNLGSAGSLTLLQEDMESWPGFLSNPDGSASYNGWSNANGSTGPDWSVDANGTGSSNTGPDVDHTLGTSTGQYTYLETSSGSTGGFDELLSPAIDVSAVTNATVSFWYHMHGASMGTLALEASTDGSTWTQVFSISGEQHGDETDPWTQASVNVDAFTGGDLYLKFVGVRGTSFSGDMALDDIEVTGSTPSVTFSDNCPGEVLVQTGGLPPGSTYPVGTTTNTFMVTDAAGNTATCSFDVTVTDDEDPTISCPADITVANDAGICGAVVSYTVTAADNCPGEVMTIISGMASGSTFPVGTTSVAWLVTDASGNTASCGFDITVEDTEAPMVNCPPDTTLTTDPGVCEANFTYTVPFSDNCPGATITYTGGGGMTTNLDVDTTYVMYGATGTSLHRINHTDGSSFQIGPLGANGDIRTIDFDETEGIAGGTVPGGVVLPPDTICTGATDSVETPIDINNGQSGNAFNIINTSGTPLEITGLSQGPASGNATNPGVTMEVYMYPDDYRNNMTSTGWTLVGTAVVDLTTNDFTGFVPVSGVTIPIGGTYGFWIGRTVGSVGYTNGTGTPGVSPRAFDANLTVTEGHGGSYPLGFNFSPRNWNGRVHYSTEQCTIVPAPSGEATNSEWIDQWTAAETLIGSDPKSNFSYEWINGTLYAVQLEPDTDLDTLHQQDFSGQNGKGATGGMPIITDLTGVNWTIDVTGTSMPDNGDWFRVENERMEANDVDGPAIWFSEPIDISTYSAVNFSLLATETGDLEPTDYMDIAYSTDGGSTWITITDWNGLGDGTHTFIGDEPDDDDWESETVSATGLSGSTLVIRVTMFNDNDSPGEPMQIDNLMVTGNPYMVATLGTMSGGSLTPIAVVSPPNTLPIDGMAYDAPNDILYAISMDALYTLDYNTGAATLVGNTGVSGLTTLDYNPEDGMLYASAQTGSIYSINSANGSASLLSSTGIALNSITWVQVINIASDATITGNYPVGTTTESFFVIDDAGNTASCSFDITVVDEEDPTISCPADVFVNNAPGDCEALVNYVIPITSDNCPGETATLVSGLGSGSLFPVGTTTEIWMVTDAAGNTATCSFTVTVTDNEPPTIACVPDLVVPTDPGVCGANVAFTQTLTLLQEDFESWPCCLSNPNGTATYNGWSNTNGTTTPDWSVDAGGTTSGSTGPDVDHTLGTSTGQYVYLETSGLVGSDNLLSPAIDLSAVTTAELTFWYHMYGATMGTLAVEASSNGTTWTQLFSISGQQHTSGTDPWTMATVDLSAYTGGTVFIRFVGIRGTSFTGDLAIDDVTVTGQQGIVAGDNCPGTTVMQIGGLPSGSFFPLGSTTNTFMATDAAGNTATCSFTVTVEDTESPVFTSGGGGSIVPTQLLVQDFESGLSVPAGWSATGLWHVSNVCAPAGAPNPTNWAYFGQDATCDYATGAAVSGSLLAPSFTVPSLGGTVTFDYVYEGEGGSLGGFDYAGFGINGVEVMQLSANVNENMWLSATIDLTPYAGQNITLEWFFDSGDGVANATLGLVVDNVVVSGMTAVECYQDTIIANAEPGLCGANVIVGIPTATDNCAVDTITNDFNGTGDASDFYPVGTTTVIWTAFDESGNTATCRQIITVIDTQDPTITCPADILVSNDPGVCEAFVTVPAPTASDNCPITVTNDYNGTADASDDYPVGSTTVVFTVEDESGLTATCSMVITVEDTEVPTITCPNDTVVGTEPGLCGAIVQYDFPVATDNCPGTTVTLVQGQGSLSLFPIGTTTNIYMVTDAAGNTATCSFTVTVEDTEPPTIVDCPSNIIVSNDPGDCGAIVTWIEPVAVDNCPGATIVGTASPGDFFPVGTTTVVYTATDDAGNTSTCSFNVIVQDTEAPVIDGCPTDIETCDPVVTWTAPTATDNCSLDTLIGSHTSGSTFPIGVTTVVYTATDDVGNVSTCSFTITVNPLPTADAGPDVDVCSGLGVTIGGNPTASGTVGPYTYSWAPAGSLDDPSLANPTATPSATTTYTVTVTDDNGCTDTDEVTVTVNPLPTASAGLDQDICLNESTTIGGNPTASGTVGPYTYSWAPAAGLSSTNAANPTAGPTTTTTYTVTVTDANGCQATDEVTVTVNPLPDATINPAGPFCENEGSQTLTAVTPGGTWSGNGITDPAAGTFNPAVAGVGTHQITYVVTDANGCSNSATELVTVLEVPDARILAAGPFCETDDPVFLTGLPNITPSTWSGAGVSANGQFDPGAAGPGSHVITYMVTNANGCSDTTTTTIVVHPQPVVVIQTGGPFCELDPVATFTASVPGGIWSGPGIIQPQLGQFLPIAAGAGVHDIEYAVTSANGCEVIESIQVMVFEVPAITSIVTEASCQDAADGAIDITVTGGTQPNYDYLWSNGETTEDLTGVAPGTYTVTVTDGNGCAQTASITVGISTTPVVAQAVIHQAFNYNTANGRIDLTVSGGASPYDFLWSNGETTEDIDSLLPGNYTVTIIDAALCSYTFTYNVPSQWPVGIDLSELDKNISLYPNPTSDVINVDIEVGAIDADMTMTVYDVLGRKLYEVHDAFTGGYQHRIEMQNWASGHYMIRFDINGQQLTKKFILAK